MKLALTILSCASAVAVREDYEPELYEHTHTIYGEQDVFGETEVFYEEIQYDLTTRTESEVRTRQVPVTESYTEEITRYEPAEEQRNTKAYEIRYRPNVYTRFTWEPRTAYDSYIETKYRDVPFTTYETHYEVLYVEELEPRFTAEIEILERPGTVTQYRDEPETRYTNEYNVLFREETVTRYNTVFDEQIRIEHETHYRTEEETRVKTVYEVEYQNVTTTATREVPVITYETAYRDEETVTYVTEYETRTRDIPVEKEVVGSWSNDSGDGIDSEPENVVTAQELETRLAVADGIVEDEAAATDTVEDAVRAQEVATLAVDQLSDTLDFSRRGRGRGGNFSRLFPGRDNFNFQSYLNRYRWA